MTDLSYDRRQKMVGALILVGSGAIMLTLIGGAVTIVLHFVIKYW